MNSGEFIRALKKDNPKITIKEARSKYKYYAKQAVIPIPQESFNARLRHYFREKKDIKVVVLMSDLHCGHRAGLTPKGWQYTELAGEGTQFKKYGDIQKEYWEWYEEVIRLIKKDCSNYGRKRPHVLFVNGDCIDGRAKKSGGTELITTDRFEQSDMAIECINMWNADKVYMTYGTPYHTGTEEDYEAYIAKHVKARALDDRLFVKVHDIVFDIKHKVGSSNLPYTRFTQVAKAAYLSDVWAMVGISPKSDIIVRSHVHYWGICKDRSKVAITTPALQAPHSKFGGRQCDGLVDFGVVVIKISQFGIESIEPYLMDAESRKVKVIEA